MFGLKAGLTFLGEGTATVTLGGFVRVLEEKRVEYTRRTCTTVLFPGCTQPTAGSKVFGGQVFGGFLTLAFPRRL